MLSLAAQLERIFPECGDSSTAGADWYLAGLMQRASEVLEREGKRIVLFIDGLDQTEGEWPPCPLLWFIPVAPPGFSVVCASRPLYPGQVQWMQDSGSYACIDLDDAEWLASNDNLCVRYAEQLPKRVHRRRARRWRGCIKRLHSVHGRPLRAPS
jgi:hypothetical protein